MKSFYRAELEGLRAIAVIAVIIYHAELSWRGMTLLPGGFLGVDVFFVLSGFLITGILVERSPSLWAFYKGRLDRIYPALLLMLVFSSIAAYTIIPPYDMLVFAEQLKGALGFYSNYVFMHEDSYVSDASKYKALIHTWSLGIEWQYYLIFPIIIYAIKRFFNAQLEQIIIFLFAVSFFYCLYLMQINPSYAFYSTPARIWQLFGGGLVFLLSRHINDTKYNSYLSALGLVIIACSLLFFKDTDNHPGFISFAAVVGSALFILFTRPATLSYKLTTLKISVFLGMISYPLYLYHQPILAFYRLGFAEVGNKGFLMLFPLMVLAAYLSYKLFENPMRKSKRKSKYLVILALIVLVFSFANGAQNTNGYDKRQSEAVRNALVHFEEREWHRLFQSPEGETVYGDKTEKCTTRTADTACITNNGHDTIVVVGDSFAGIFSYSFSNVKVKTVNYTNGQCPLLADPMWFGGVPECWEVNKLRWQEIKKMKPSTFLIGTNFNLFNNAKRSKATLSKNEINTSELLPKSQAYYSFRQSIEELISLGHKPVVLLQPPNPSQDVKKEMLRKVSSGALIFKEERLGTPTYEVDVEVKKTLDGIEGVTYIDLNSKLCNSNNKCLTFNHNGGLYNHDDHLSYYGVQLFMSDILKEVKARK